MEIKQFLREAASTPGLSGNESAVAQYIAECFRPYCDEVFTTPLYSVVGHIKGDGPKVMFAAHLDEIGLMVVKIEEDGCLRLGNVGGVDPRILPGMRVRVHTQEGEKLGVIGAKAPHLLTDEERSKNYLREDLYVDMGMSYEQVVSMVRIGDLVQLETRFNELQNRRFVTKTADDRACVAILLRAMQLLQGLKHNADLYFVATSQEEVGAYGAMTAAFHLSPDFGVALDVCHAITPDAPKVRTHELTSLVASTGPYIHPVLRKKMMDVASENNITIQTAVVARNTHTDTDAMNTVRGGLPTILLELPLKYMHTAVELFDMRVLEEGGRLLAAFAAAVKPSWEDELWI